MSSFWTVSLFWAAAVVCVILALAFVLPALLRSRSGTTQADRRDVNIAVYRDQLKEMEADRANGLLSEEQFQAARLELEARLADDAISAGDAPEPGRAGNRKLGYSLGAAIPVAAFGLYFLLGNPTSLIAIADAQANAVQAGMTNVPGGHDIMKMIQQVEEKTKINPNDGEAWAMLGKTYAVVGHWPEALHAYEKAIKLLPEKPSVMTGYAEALAITGNRVLQGRPMDLIMKALEKDPSDMKGLELAGIYHFQEKNYARAAFYMKHLYKLLPPESPYAKDILAAQQEAERLLNTSLTGLESINNPTPANQSAEKIAAAAIHGHVSITPALKAKIPANAVVFLFAKPIEGGMPVAALRSEASKLPLEFELDDTMAMNPQMRLSLFKEVALTARISMSGEAMAKSGDFEGTLTPVKVGAKDIKLVINSVKP